MPKAFRVSGSFRTVHHDQPFSKEVIAENEAGAREYILSLFGSKHRVPRRLIRIDSVAALADADVENSVVRHQLGLSR